MKIIFHLYDGNAVTFETAEEFIDFSEFSEWYKGREACFGYHIKSIDFPELGKILSEGDKKAINILDLIAKSYFKPLETITSSDKEQLIKVIDILENFRFVGNDCIVIGQILAKNLIKKTFHYTSSEELIGSLEEYHSEVKIIFSSIVKIGKLFDVDIVEQFINLGCTLYYRSFSWYVSGFAEIMKYLDNDIDIEAATLIFERLFIKEDGSMTALYADNKIPTYELINIKNKLKETKLSHLEPVVEFLDYLAFIRVKAELGDRLEGFSEQLVLILSKVTDLDRLDNEQKEILVKILSELDHNPLFSYLIDIASKDEGYIFCDDFCISDIDASHVSKEQIIMTLTKIAERKVPIIISDEINIKKALLSNVISKIRDSSPEILEEFKEILDSTSNIGKGINVEVLSDFNIQDIFSNMLGGISSLMLRYGDYEVAIEKIIRLSPLLAKIWTAMFAIELYEEKFGTLGKGVVKLKDISEEADAGDEHGTHPTSSDDVTIDRETMHDDPAVEALGVRWRGSGGGGGGGGYDSAAASMELAGAEGYFGGDA